MTLDHCVISCYHAVITDLLCGKEVTAYEIKNDLNFSGIHLLYKKERLDFQSQNILKKGPFDSEKNSKKSSSASDFSRTAQTHLKALPYTQSLFKTPATDNIHFLLQFSGIFNHICDINTSHWKCLSSNFKENTKFSILKSFEQLSQELFPKTSKSLSDSPESIFGKPFSTPVDGIYHYHIMERIFNFNLLYCLLRNIHRIEKNTLFRLGQKEILDTLCLCQKLPNTFSRQYFLQYAFDKLITTPISYLDFWHNHRLDMSTSIIESPQIYELFSIYEMA